MSKSTLLELLKRDSLCIKEITLFDFVSQWIQSQTLSSTNNLWTEILPFIRLPLFTIPEFAQKVMPLNILDSNQSLSFFSYLSQKQSGHTPTLPDSLSKWSTTKRKASMEEFNFGEMSNATRFTFDEKTRNIKKTSTCNDWVLGDKEWTDGLHEWGLRLDSLNHRGSSWDDFLVIGVTAKALTSSITDVASSGSYGIMNPQYSLADGVQSTLDSGTWPEWKSGMIVSCKLDLDSTPQTFQVKTKLWTSTVIKLPPEKSWRPYWNVYATNDSITLVDVDD